MEEINLLQLYPGVTACLLARSFEVMLDSEIRLS